MGAHEVNEQADRANRMSSLFKMRLDEFIGVLQRAQSHHATKIHTPRVLYWVREKVCLYHV
ncbi:unnamed protein product [Boreogadus saida]